MVPAGLVSVTSRLSLPKLADTEIVLYRAPGELSQAAELSRSQTRHTSTSIGTGLVPRSSLHEEMAVYQKRLQVHHEKEMLDAQGGGSSTLPVDPPPVYREADEEEQPES